MLLQNKTKTTYQAAIINDKQEIKIIELTKGSVKNIPDDIAKKWLNINGIDRYIAPKEAKKLEDENKKLKEELEALKSQKEDSLEELKKQADELGIKYASNIGIEKLQKKIETAKKEKTEE